MVEKLRKTEYQFIILAITITLFCYLIGTHIAILEEYSSVMGNMRNINYIYNLELSNKDIDLYQFRLHATNLAVWLSLIIWTPFRCHKVCRKIDSTY